MKSSNTRLKMHVPVPWDIETDRKPKRKKRRKVGLYEIIQK